MPIKIGLMEIVNQALYDTVNLGHNPISRSYHLFCTPIGLEDPYGTEYGKWDGKQWLHTNMLQAGMLDAPKQFFAKRVNLLFLCEGVPLRIYETSLYARTHISFRVAEKTYWQGPGWMAASPFALFGTPQEEIQRMSERYGVEWDSVGANLVPFSNKDANFEHGIRLDVQESFMVEARIYEGGDHENKQLAVHIDGDKIRPVL